MKYIAANNPSGNPATVLLTKDRSFPSRSSTIIIVLVISRSREIKRHFRYLSVRAVITLFDVLKSLMCRLTFPRLRLHRGDRNRVDDVFGFAAAREVVARAVETLKDRSDRGSAG